MSEDKKSNSDILKTFTVEIPAELEGEIESYKFSNDYRPPSLFNQVTDKLFIASELDQNHLPKMKELGITAIVNLMRENKLKINKQFAYIHISHPDQKHYSMKDLKKIFKFIEKQLKKKGGKVMIQCFAGISRSGGIMVGRLLQEHPEWRWNDGLEFVRKVRFIQPAAEVMWSVLDYLEKIDGTRRD
jgi:protein-tyrosine phosphatase